jgi:hypothetical protein
MKIREIINTFNVDYLIIPYSCEINHSSFQPKAWRDSPHYIQPIKYSVLAKTHLQIWNHEGDLVYECISIKKTGKPFLNSFLVKIIKKKDDDIVKYSKSPFAPPSLKSLSKAISSAMNITAK